MDDLLQILAQTLVERGLRTAFGITGSGASLKLITYLEALGARYYPATHEAAAAIMAGAVSRLRNQPSASIAIKGPGFANMLPGILNNYYEHIPVLSMAEAYGDSSPHFRKHKRLDHSQMLTSITKGHISLTQLRTSLTPLLDTANAENPGPVHVDLAEIVSTKFEPPVSDPESEPAEIQAIFDTIGAAARPVLVIGALATRQSWGGALASLQIPIFTTAAAKGVLDESLPHAAGVFTGTGEILAPEYSLFFDCDLVIGIGLRNDEVINPKPFPAKTILIDAVRGAGEGFEASQIAIIRDGTIYTQILDLLRLKAYGIDELVRCKGVMVAELVKGAWLPADCFIILNRLPFVYALVLDTGSFCTIGEHIWLATRGRLFVGSNNARNMGAGLPTGVGAAIGKPGFPVISVVGDGGMRMYPSELKLAVSENLPLCTIFMSDGRYGSIANVRHATSVSTRATTMFEPSWWRIAEAMGIESVQVSRIAEFADAINGWSKDRPLFIEAVFAPERYSTMTKRIR